MAIVEVVVNGETFTSDDVDLDDVPEVVEHLETGKPLSVKKTRKKVEKIEEVKKTSRGKGKNNETRTRALEIIEKMKTESVEQKVIIKRLTEELKISHANAWYYLNKVAKTA